VINACGGLQEWLPGLALQILSSQHGYNDSAQSITALKRASERSPSIEIRLAALMVQSGDSLDQLRQHIALSKSSAELIELSNRLWPSYQRLEVMNADALLYFLNQAKAWKQPEKFEQLLAVLSVQDANYSNVNLLKEIAKKAASINVADLQAKGVTGKALGEAIAEQRLAIAKVVLLKFDTFE